MLQIICRLFRRPIRAWKAGGWFLKANAIYAFISPLLVSSFTAGKLAGVTAQSWWVVPILMTIGHLNTAIIVLSLGYYDRRLQRGESSI